MKAMRLSLSCPRPSALTPATICGRTRFLGSLGTLTATLQDKHGPVQVGLEELISQQGEETTELEICFELCEAYLFCCGALGLTDVHHHEGFTDTLTKLVHHLVGSTEVRCLTHLYHADVVRSSLHDSAVACFGKGLQAW